MSTCTKYITKAQAKMISQIQNTSTTSTLRPHIPQAKNTAEMAKMKRSPSTEWIGQTQGIIEMSNAEVSNAKACRDASAKESEGAKYQTESMLTLVNDKLKKKIAETNSLLTKLQGSVDTLQGELDKVQETKENAEQQRDEIQRPLRKCQNRQGIRAGRPERDNIDDKVASGIQSELSELTAASQALDEWINKCARLIDGMEKVKSLLNEDMSDKRAALEVDQACVNLPIQVSPPKSMKSSANTPRKNPVVAGAAEGPNSVGKSAKAPSAWRENSTVLMARAKELCNVGQDLRTAYNVYIKKMKETVKSLSANVNEMFKKKITTTAQLHTKLSKQRLQLHEEVQRLNAQREKVLSELQDKTIPLEMVSKRLELRKTRPSREQVRDEAEEALEVEYQKLVEVVNRLKEKLQTIDNNIAKLSTLQEAVNLDLEDKTTSLSIDRRCVDVTTQSTASRATGANGFNGGSIAGGMTLPLIPTTPRDRTPRSVRGSTRSSVLM